MKKTTVLLMVLLAVLTMSCIVLGALLNSHNKTVENLELEVSNLENEISQKTELLIQAEKQIELLQQENQEITDRKHDLDIEYEKAMATWINTMEGVEIINSFGDIWKEEMDKYYTLLYDMLEEDRKKWLISSQEKWEIYTKENEELAWQTYDQVHHDGSIMKIYSAEIYLERYRSRAKTLIHLYNSLISY